MEKAPVIAYTVYNYTYIYINLLNRSILSRTLKDFVDDIYKRKMFKIRFVNFSNSKSFHSDELSSYRNVAKYFFVNVFTQNWYYHTVFKCSKFVASTDRGDD